MNLFVGYLQFDDRDFAVRNPVTGQSLTVAGPNGNTAPPSAESTDRWLQFNYSDPDTVCSLWVEVVRAPCSEGPTWFLDYEQSGFDTSSYGLWLRIDGFVIDALEYFSFSKTLAHDSAFEISARGGWYLLGWNGEAIRTQKSPKLLFTSDSPQVLSSYLAPLELKYTEPWQLIQVQDTPDALAALKPWKTAMLLGAIKYDTYKHLHDLISAGSFFANAGGTRLLIPAPVPHKKVSSYEPLILGPGYDGQKLEQQFLYLDEDCLFHPISISRENNRASLRLRVFRPRVPRDTRQTDWGLISLKHKPIEGEFELAEKPGVLPGEKNLMMPDWVENRIRTACMNAIAALHPDRDYSASLPDCQIEMDLGSFPDGNDRKWVLSNSTLTRDLTSSKQRPELAASHSRSVSSVDCKVYGWWSFDRASETLFNRETKQVVSIEKMQNTAAPDFPSWLQDRQWWQLTYNDSETSYSIPVAHKLPEQQLTIPFFHRPLASYGLWRRIETAIVDALLCWPKRNRTGNRISRVNCIGGWANSKWHNNLSVFTHRQGTALKHAPITGVQLPSLSAEAPIGWEFVDADSVRDNAWLSGLSWENKTDLYTTNEERFFCGGHRRLSGSAVHPFSGFQQKVPYLRRKDGSAVFFPARVESTVAADLRGEFPMYASRIACIYADKDFAAVFLQKGMAHLKFDIQSASLSPKDHFFSYPLDERQHRSDGREYLELPDWQQWLSLRERLSDLGLAWWGSDAHLKDDPDRVSQLKNSFPCRWGGMKRPEPVGLGPCVNSEFLGLYFGGIFEPQSRQLAGAFDIRELTR